MIEAISPFRDKSEYEQQFDTALRDFETRTGYAFSGEYRELLKSAFTRDSYYGVANPRADIPGSLELARTGDRIVKRQLLRWVHEVHGAERTERSAMNNLFNSNVFFSSLALKLRMNECMRMQGSEQQAESGPIKNKKLADTFEAFIEVLNRTHGIEAVRTLLRELIFDAPELAFYKSLFAGSPAAMQDALRTLTGGECEINESHEFNKITVRISMRNAVDATGTSNHPEGAMRTAVSRFLDSNPWLIWRHYEENGEEMPYVGNATPRYQFALYRKIRN